MNAVGSDTLFDADFLRRLESLSLLARTLRRGAQRAERRSVQRGASVEFAEYRPFVAGDDYKYIDWNAFARWRQLVLKLFVEEEDLHVHLLLDGSASMTWGTPRKFDYARQVVAGIAYLGLANLDRVSLTLLGSPAGAEMLPATRGRHRFLHVLRWLGSREVQSGPRPLEDSVRGWTATRPRRGLVIWVGDFWGTDAEDAFRALDRLRYGRHDVALIQVRDPGEAEAGTPGEFELEDVESGTVRRVVISPQMARAYRERFDQYQDSLQAATRRHQMPMLAVDTRLDVGDLLQRALLTGGFVR